MPMTDIGETAGDVERLRREEIVLRHPLPDRREALRFAAESDDARSRPAQRGVNPAGNGLESREASLPPARPGSSSARP